MQSLLQYRRIGQAVQKNIAKGGHISGTTRPLHQTPSQPYHENSISRTQTDAVNHAGVALETLNSHRSLKHIHTQHTIRTAIAHGLFGIHVRDRASHEGEDGKVFIVTWDDENDPLNPRNWSTAYRVFLTLMVAMIAFAVGAASSADTAVLPQAAKEFGVSDVVESLTIGLYLVGYAVGALVVGPFSETFGRNATYIVTMIIFMIFLAAAALAPNIASLFVFRFIAGAFGAAPLTCAGGSISDLWSTLEKTFAFPVYAIFGFGGTVLGPVIASYVINLGSTRWSEWIVLILSGLVLALIVVFQPETYPPLLLQWKAKHLRRETGDNRFRAEAEIIHSSLWTQLKIALSRPVQFTTEPIVVINTLYLTVLYIVLFTFLVGYSHIFQDVYGISQGLTNVLFTGICVGIILAGLLVPWIYKITKQSMAQKEFVPEMRLWFAMLGAPAIPISLFWMGWTDFSSISIWSPIMASVLLGYGLICIFMTTYMYIIDSYEIYAASALSFVTFTRYLVAGGFTVVGVPFYQNMGPQWTLTILGGISVVMTPIPYVFYKYGHVARSRSRYAVL